jgi:hypothetical protein
MNDQKYNNEELCAKIQEVFPDIGKCGIDMDVAYDEENKAYRVKMKKGHLENKTFLETKDADLCMEGKQCVGLGIQIAQFRD